LRIWLEVEKDQESFRTFLQDHIYQARDFQDYLLRCGGLNRLQRLRQHEFLIDSES